MSNLAAILKTCSPAEVRATTHALLLQVARDGNPAAFPDDMKGALALAMIDAGVTPDTQRQAWDAAIEAYVANHPIRDDLLLGLKHQLGGRR